MSEEEREQIMKEHEQNMIRLDNSLALTKLKQRQILEEKLADRRAKRMEQLQQKQMVESKVCEFERRTYIYGVMRKHCTSIYGIVCECHTSTRIYGAALIVSNGGNVLIQHLLRVSVRLENEKYEEWLLCFQKHQRKHGDDDDDEQQAAALELLKSQAEERVTTLNEEDEEVNTSRFVFHQS